MTGPYPNEVLMVLTMECRSTAAPKTNGSRFPWAIKTGSGTRAGVTVLPIGKNNSRVCWCYLLCPAYWGATLWFGDATKNRYAVSKRDPYLRRLSSDTSGPTRANCGSQCNISRVSRRNVPTT